MYRGALALELSESFFVSLLNDIHPTADGLGFALTIDGDLYGTESAAVIRAAANDPAVADVLRRMKAGESGNSLITLNGQQMLVGFAPMQGLGTQRRAGRAALNGDRGGRRRRRARLDHV